MSLTLPSDEIAGDYKSSLEELHDSSRQEINHLTLIAGENIEHAAAIARTLENHIRTINPNRKLPALYLLDSIVKNVGTPYTLFFGSSLYSTFMNAYSLVNPYIRQKLDEMLGTWKLPNPGSSDPTPVFPPETTRPIEEALMKARTSAVEQNRQQQLRAQQEMLNRSRQVPQLNGYWQDLPIQTHTNIPQNTLPHFQSPLYQQPTSTIGHHLLQTQPLVVPPNYAQPTSNVTTYQNQFPASASKPPYVPPVDLSALHQDIGDLIWSTRSEVASNPHDDTIQTRLKALLDLQNLLRQQYHPPAQLQQVRTQVTQLQAAAKTDLPKFSSNESYSPIPMITNGHDQESHLRYDNRQSSSTPAPAIAPSDLQALLSSASLAKFIAKAQGDSVDGDIPVSTNTLSLMPAVADVNSSAQAAEDSTSALLASLQARGLLNPSNAMPSPAPLIALASHKNESFGLASEEIELSSVSLKIPRPHLLERLYGSQSNQCTTCGRRFADTQNGRNEKRQHYDWHFKTNQRTSEASKRAQNRSWFVNELEWIHLRENPHGDADSILSESQPITHASKTSAGASKSQYILVPTDQALANLPCPICQEKFVASYRDEVSDWVWEDAIKIGARIYHASCHAEIRGNSSRDATPLRTSTPDSVLGKRKGRD